MPIFSEKALTRRLLPLRGATMRLFLASSSPRRSDILSQFGIPFEVIPNCLEDECLETAVSLRMAVRRLALEKAVRSVGDFSGLILGVDTIVVCDGHVIGKPRDRMHVRDIIGGLQGRSHQVITAFGLVDTVHNRNLSRSDIATVTIRSMTGPAMDRYSREAPVLDKAGAYGVQDETFPIVEKVIGSRYTVMGLPIVQLLGILKNYSIDG